MATLPVELVSSKDPAKRKLLTPSPLVTEPYAEISLMDWWSQFVTSLAIRGNFFGLIIERQDGYPTQIKPIHPDRASVKRNPNGEVEYRFNGRIVPIQNVFHVRMYSVPGGLEGLNPIEYMRNAMGVARAQDLFNAAVYANGAVPRGTIEVEDDLDVDETLALAKEWTSAHQGIGQSNLPAVLTGGAKFNAISMTPADAQFIAAKQFSLSEIAMIFRIPPHLLSQVEKSTCLVGDAKVFTEHGPQDVKSLSLGTKVWSFNEATSNFQLSPVVGVQATGIDPILTIRTEGRTLRANAKHRMLVRRKHPDPQPGQGGYRKVKWTNDWVSAGELETGDLLVAAHGMPQSDIQFAPNGRELTEGFMASAGLLIGDGNVLLNAQGDPSIVTFARHAQARYMPQYREFLQAEFTRASKGGRFVYAQREEKPITLREYERSTTFSSRSAAEELTALGFSGTAKTKRVPPWIFGISPELQLAFIRGYADADGHVNRRGEMRIGSVNRELLEDVRHLLIGLGIPVGGILEIAPKEEPVEIGGRMVHSENPMHEIGLYDAQSNLRIGSHDPRDQGRLEEAASTPSTRRRRYDPDWQGRGASPESRPCTYFDIEGAVLHRIVSIEESTLAEPVYDISVADTHTFIADGIVVHNSWGKGLESQERAFISNTLSGYLVRGERALTKLLPPNQFLEFNLSARVKPERIELANANSLGMLGGWLCADDCRAEENRAPLPNGEGKKTFAPINTELLAEAVIQVEAAKVEKEKAEKGEQEKEQQPEAFPPAKTNGHGNSKNIKV